MEHKGGALLEKGTALPGKRKVVFISFALFVDLKKKKKRNLENAQISSPPWVHVILLNTIKGGDVAHHKTKASVVYSCFL